MAIFPWGSSAHGFVNFSALPVGQFSLPRANEASENANVLTSPLAFVILFRKSKVTGNWPVEGFQDGRATLIENPGEQDRGSDVASWPTKTAGARGRSPASPQSRGWPAA